MIRALMLGALMLGALMVCGLIGFGWVFSRLGIFMSGWILTGVMP